MQEVDLLDSDLSEKLKGLEEGKSFTVALEDGSQVTYINPPKPVICTNHYYEFDGEHDSEHDCYKCRSCPNGRIINKKTHEVKDGRIKVRL